ncbi:MAG: glucosaminidase domain-containing protein [Proteobacteria bacterium]|nr:glucosaminidase domain-containing protein [Pseudomonadota bacterium]
MANRLLLSALLALMFIVPAGAGVMIVENARHNVYFGDRVRYLLHFPAPDTRDQVMAKFGYEVRDILKDGLPVPRVFLADLPESLDDLTVSERKQVFTQTILPLVLRTNEIIREDRARLLEFRDRLAMGGKLDKLENRWLTTLAIRYRLRRGATVGDLDLTELLKRVDAIPPSLALAQAAIESGWGTSRFAQSGNALYGQWTRGTSNGLVPIDRDEGRDHTIKTYDYLIQSVLSYARNLNSHRAYREFRERRAALKTAEDNAPGVLLAETLTSYSARPEIYIKEIKAVITGNGFADLETARLEPTWWAAP